MSPAPTFHGKKHLDSTRAKAMPREDFVEALLLKGEQLAAHCDRDELVMRFKKFIYSDADFPYPTHAEPRAPKYIKRGEETYRRFADIDYTEMALFLEAARHLNDLRLKQALTDPRVDKLLTEMSSDTNGCVGRLRKLLDAARAAATADRAARAATADRAATRAARADRLEEIK